MRGKQKMWMGVLITTFIATSGMFYYQNVYMDKKDLSNQVTVLIAKSDIAEGSEFTKDNIAAVKMDKELVLPIYITNFEDLKGKSANEDITQHELVTKPDIKKDQDGSKLFQVGIESKKMPAGIQKGDTVRVYVKVEDTTYELFEKKEVASVNYKKSSAGKDTGTITSIDLVLSDKEAVSYMNARDAGDVYPIRYHDLTDIDTIDVPKFDENYDVIVQEAASKDSKTASKETKTSTQKQAQTQSGNVTYVVKVGDTFESIAQAYGTTQDQIKTLNPGVTTLTPGDKLVITKA